MKLSGWGRYPVLAAKVTGARREEDVLAAIGTGAMIARGNGRAYGDSAINTAATIDMRSFDRMLDFDAASGRLVAEGGVLLSDVIGTFLPRGWFPAVTPGTKFVSLGGMVASDVHGKNHHIDGSFGQCVDWFDLACADGTVRRCSRVENADLFAATLGGMGLTGVVLRVALRLRPVETGWIHQKLLPTRNLAETMAAFEASGDATYSVAWIDCFAGGRSRGRSIVMLGEHAGLDALPARQRRDRYALSRRPTRSVPFDFPGGLLNGLSIRAFNQLYYWKNSRFGLEGLVDWDSYFYPLDAILHWNRIYGRRGFAQFQCVLPEDCAHAGLEALLAEIAAAGSGSFLSVLKRFGAEAAGGISFPMPGYTLALDFPISSRTLALLDRLDAITLAHGGRFYLAKDSRMRAETLTRADRRVDAFRLMRSECHLASHFRSAQSERLEL